MSITAPLSFTVPIGGVLGQSLAAGQQASGPLSLVNASTFQPTGWDYTFPDPQLRPRGDFVVERIYLPIAIDAKVAAAQPPATTCRYTVSFNIRGQIRWSHAGVINGLASFSATENTGNDVIADDLVNPLLIHGDETGRLEYAIGFDQPVTSWSFFVGAQTGRVVAGAIYGTYTSQN